VEPYIHYIAPIDSIYTEVLTLHSYHYDPRAGSDFFILGFPSVTFSYLHTSAMIDIYWYLSVSFSCLSCFSICCRNSFSYKVCLIDRLFHGDSVLSRFCGKRLGLVYVLRVRHIVKNYTEMIYAPDYYVDCYVILRSLSSIYVVHRQMFCCLPVRCFDLWLIKLDLAAFC